MDGAGRGKGIWRNLKQRLALKGIGLCGSSWSLIEEEEDALQEQPARAGVGQNPAETTPPPPPPCAVQTLAARASSGMNLATALAAERNVRPSGPATGRTPNFMPLKSLMGLFEDRDGEDRKRRKTEDGGVRGRDVLCCVCMERNKGAAFIPCGHTYCRVCSREMWLCRGSCPLCNRSITNILDIF